MTEPNTLFHFIYTCGIVEQFFVAGYVSLTVCLTHWRGTGRTTRSVSAARAALCGGVALRARAGNSVVYVPVCIDTDSRCMHSCAPPLLGDSRQATQARHALLLLLAPSCRAHSRPIICTAAHRYAHTPPPPWWMHMCACTHDYWRPTTHRPLLNDLKSSAIKC